MMATSGVMVGKIVGVGFCTQAKGRKNPGTPEGKVNPLPRLLLK
jgi:hypothetical protein